VITHFLLEGEAKPGLTLKMEVACSYETSLSTYKTTWCHNTEETISTMKIPKFVLRIVYMGDKPDVQICGGFTL
jgi:hypothetical protein